MQDLEENTSPQQPETSWQRSRRRLWNLLRETVGGFLAVAALLQAGETLVEFVGRLLH